MSPGLQNPTKNPRGFSVSTLDYAGVNDQGQISRLMFRLGQQGLVENTCSMNTTSPRKGTQVSNPRNIPRSLLCRLGVPGHARVRAFGGTGAPKSPLRLFLSILLPALAVLALTAVPALAAAPKVLSESAPFANASEARLEGVVNPESEVTECHFQYGKTLVSENEVQCEQSVIEGGEQGVGVTVLGLSKTTTYAYRVVLKNIATNEEGFGATEHFTTATPPEKPETSSPAKSVSATSAVLEGTLNPKASGEVETGSYFLYSTEARCSEATGQTEPVAAAKIKPKTKTGPVEVVGLEPNETYVFCLVATNSVGEATLMSRTSICALASTSLVSFSPAPASGTMTSRRSPKRCASLMPGVVSRMSSALLSSAA